MDVYIENDLDIVSCTNFHVKIWRLSYFSHRMALARTHRTLQTSPIRRELRLQYQLNLRFNKFMNHSLQLSASCASASALRVCVCESTFIVKSDEMRWREKN